MQRNFRYHWMDDGRKGGRNRTHASTHKMDLLVSVCLKKVQHTQEVMHPSASIRFVEHQAVIRIHIIAVIVVKEVPSAVLVGSCRQLTDTTHIERETNVLLRSIRVSSQQDLFQCRSMRDVQRSACSRRKTVLWGASFVNGM